jgi:hypothetical protein
VRREVDTGAEQTLPLTRMDFGAPTGTITLGLAEKGIREPVTARVSVQQKDGKYVAPAGALYWMLGNGVEHFYAAGSAQLTVPAGSYVIRGVRGLEYLETRVEVDVIAGRETARLGWNAGRIHRRADGGAVRVTFMRTMDTGSGTTRRRRFDFRSRAKA